MMSYIESGAIANKEMQQMSKMYNTISRISDRVATQLERPMNERFYKDLNNFVYGLAIDDYLSIDGGRKIVMTRKGIKRTYNLGKTKRSAGELGRIEFMNEFPYYFKNDLIPRRENTLQNYMTVEILGKESKEYTIVNSFGIPERIKTPDETVPVLKTIGDFRTQSPEKRIEIMSMMQNLEESPNNKPDLGNYGDSSVKQMLFLYSLIKDKGGNSPTSYTALFDANDFADFDDHMEGWESDYDLNKEEEMDDLIAQFKGFSTNSPKQGVRGEINIHPKHRFAIPYKNDKTANDLSDLSETVTRLNERKVSKIDELIKAVNDEAEAIITTMKESGPKAKKGMRIEEILAAGGYTLNEEASGEGEYVWEKTFEGNTTAISEYFSSTIDTFNVQMNDDMSDLDDDADLPSDADGTSDAPFSRFDFEESEKRRVYASKTNRKVLSTLASIISNNTGVDIEVLSSSQINQKYGNKFSQLRGFVAKDGVPVINSDVAGLDTPMHEMGHLWMHALKGSNLSLYNSIIEQVSEHEMMDKVAEQYPELEGTALAEEVFSTLFGLSQQDKALSSYNRNFLTRMRDTLMRFMEWLNETMNGLFGITPRTDDTLIDVMNKIGDRMLSSSIFNFSGSDLDTLSTFGMTSEPLSSELRAIQGELARKGLMETIC
jgi:stage V sporulation protein SpoVS